VDSLGGNDGFFAIDLGIVTAADIGKYTVLLSSTDSSAAVPRGTGYATLTVSKKGGAILAGKLADGESFSYSGVVITGTAGDQLAVNASLNYPSATTPGSKGSLAGTLTFVPMPGVSDLSGILAWNKPPQTKGKYQAPIGTNLNIIGSVYIPPTKGGSVLPGFTAGTMQLSDTSGFSLSDAAQLTSANKLTFSNSALKVTITVSTGVFKGTFSYPVQGAASKRTDIYGVLFRDQIMGGGFFLGPNGSGPVSLKQ